MLTAEVKDDREEVVAVVQMSAKLFSTGSVGYHGNGKVVIADKKYQVNFMLVEVGSKSDTRR